ncbi:MAG: TetR/AcrR family transcriptional regulator [Hyphomicrobiales bacterium]
MTGGHTPKTASTRERILDAAIDLFLENGFHTTNIDSVAARSRSSKQTIYKYYEGKEEILQHALARLIDEFQGQVLKINVDAADVRAELREFGSRYLNTLLTERHIRAFRLCVETAHKSSRLPRTAGPIDVRQLQHALRDFLQRRARNGEIEHSKDADFLAHAFLGMLHGNYLSLRALSIGEEPSEDEIRAHVGRATDFFCDALSPAAKSAEQV